MKYMGTHVSTYPWHSINIIPHLDIALTYEDNYPHKLYGSLIEFTWLGQIVHITVPVRLMCWSSPMVGPLWSRRRKMWYKVSHN